MPLRGGIGVLTASTVKAIGLVAWLAAGCRTPEEAPSPTLERVDPVDVGAGAIRVDVASARLGVLAREVTATGMTAAWREANLRAEVGGRVLEVNVDNGDRVAAGEALLRIDGSRQRIAVSGASARVEALAQDVELARTDFERKQGLVSKGSMPSAQLDVARHALERAEAALEAANADLGSARRSSRDTHLTAPIDALVTRRMVDVGDTLGPGAPLLDLVDLSRIRVHVGIAGAEIARLDTQADARVRIEDLGGEPTLGKFAALAPAADPITGLFDVEIHLDNPDGRIRGGMVATVELPLGEGREHVLVPRSALTRRGGVLAVFVLERGLDQAGVDAGLERAVARLHEVRVGAYGDSEVEILAGVAPGDLVATSGQHALADAVDVEFEPLERASPLATRPAGAGAP
jgi:multidrug efflux system membrane fusion protein